MSYTPGTHVNFKKKEPFNFFLGTAEYAIGTKVRFLNWLAPAAILDLSVA